MQPSSVARCIGDPPLQPPNHWVRGWALKAETWSSRVAVLVPACDHVRHESPPAAFIAAAVQALRSDPEELVLALVALRAANGPIARALRSLPAVRVISYAAGVNASLDMRAHFALLAADHIVVAGSPSLNWARAAQRGARRAPYHAVWSWCTADDPACADSFGPMRGNASGGAPLTPSGDNTTHVLVEARRAPAAGPSPGHPRPSSPALVADGAPLEVRSTFASEWQPLPAAATRAAFATASAPASEASLPADGGRLPLGMWALRDVCVGYGPATAVLPSIYNDVSTPGLFVDRRMLLVQAARSASAGPPNLRGAAAPRLLWPLRWPRHYNDGDARPFRSEPYGTQDAFFADVARAHAWTHDAALRNGSDAERRRRADPWASPPLRASWVESPAFVVESTLDNLFHTLFHAVALRENVLALHGPLAAAARRLLRQVGGAPAELGERSGERWGERSGEEPTAPFAWLPRYTVLWPAGASSARWVGWELTTRTLAASLGVEPPPAAATWVERGAR